MSAELKASRRDATLILTLSNPGARNALHPDMVAAAIETLSTAERDTDVRAVILTGSDGYFSIGGGVYHRGDGHANDLSDQSAAIDSLNGWIEAIRDCPKPVIAAVEGLAVNAGFSLALACDLIVAGASAQFALAYAATGTTPDGGASWFLAHALPRQLAAEILLQAKPIPASRLHAAGVINKIVTDGGALDAALGWADELATLPPHAVERIKSLLRDARQHTLTQHFMLEKQSVLETLR